MNAVGDDAKVSVLHTSTLSFSPIAVPVISTNNTVAAGVVAVGHSLPVVINGVTYSLLLS
jgi:hypothetical protein